MPFYNREDERAKTATTQKDLQHSSWWGQATDVNSPYSIPGAAKGVANAIIEPYKRITEANARALDSVTFNSQEKADDALRKSISASKKLRDTLTSKTDNSVGVKAPGASSLSESEKMMLDNLNKEIERMEAKQKGDTEQILDVTDPTKYAGAAGEVAIDALTAGAGSSVIKGAKGVEAAAEGGLNIAKTSRIKSAVDTAKDAVLNPTTGKQGLASGAILGTGYGGFGAVEENGADTTAADVIGGAAGGAAIGGALGGILGRLSSTLAKTRGRDKSPLDDIKVSELPFFQAVQRLEPSQQAKIQKAIETNPDLSMRLLEMDQDTATKFADTLIEGPKITKGGKTEKAPEVPEAATNPFTRVEPQNVEPNTITPAQKPVNDLEAAALSDNPAEYLKSKQAAETVGTADRFIAADVDPLTLPTYDGEADVTKLSQLADNSLEKTSAGVKNGAVERAKQEIENGTAQPIRIRQTPEGSVVIEDGRHRLQAARELGMTSFPIEDVSKSYGGMPVKTMAAEVTPQADIGEITMDISPADRAAEILGKKQTPRKAKDTELATIGDVDPQLAADLNLNKIDPEVAKAVTYLTQGKVSNGASENLTKSIGRYLSDSIGYATRTLGEAGAKTAESLVRGSKIKADMKTDLRVPMREIVKLSKGVAGKTETGRIKIGADIVKALEDRDNVAKYITDPETRQIYDRVVTVFDNIKQKMIDAGMPVRDNYSPWNMLKDYSESPSYLAGGLVDKKTRVVSGNAMERKLDEKPELTNNNILEVLPRYVDGMINHIAFTPVLDEFADSLDKVPAYIRANTGQFNDGIQYLNTMLANGISQGSSSTADKWIKGLQNNVYSAFLWNNPKNAAFALSQKLLARGDITGDGRKLAKAFDKDDLKLVDSKAWFGDQTVSGDINGGETAATQAGEALRGTKVGEAARKYDINRWGEQKSIEAPFRQAFAQGLSQTKAYTEAIAAGRSQQEAIKTALKDPEALAFAERSGNIQVNNTAFGANSLARPEFLRDSSALKRAITMFMRFPLGISNFIRDTIQIKDARALDVIQRGDPRATSIANMRGEYKAYLKGLKDVEKAVKSGKAPSDAPSAEVIRDHIKLVEDNVKTIDTTIKGLSSLRGPKRVAALGAMWAATAAIQFAWDGLASSINPEADAPTVAGSISKTDPTGSSLINPWNENSKVRSGLNTPLNPINKYGGVSSRTVLNAIPVAGTVNTISRTVTGGNGISDFIDDKLRGK